MGPTERPSECRVLIQMRSAASERDRKIGVRHPISNPGESLEHLANPYPVIRLENRRWAVITQMMLLSFTSQYFGVYLLITCGHHELHNFNTTLTNPQNKPLFRHVLFLNLPRILEKLNMLPLQYPRRSTSLQPQMFHNARPTRRRDFYSWVEEDGLKVSGRTSV